MQLKQSQRYRQRFFSKTDTAKNKRRLRKKKFFLKNNILQKYIKAKSLEDYSSPRLKIHFIEAILVTLRGIEPRFDP